MTLVAADPADEALSIERTVASRTGTDNAGSRGGGARLSSRSAENQRYEKIKGNNKTVIQRNFLALQ